MIKIYALIISLAFLFFPLSCYGQQKTSTPSSSIKETINKNFQNIKDNLATVVAELTKKNDSVLSGYITSINDNSIEIKTQETIQKAIQVDEITKYKDLTQEKLVDLEKKDLKENQYIVAFGNISNSNFTANFVNKENDYIIINGEISNIKNDNYTIEVITPEKDMYLVSVETYTERKVLDIKTFKYETIGFSKIKIGDKAHIVSLKQKNKQGQYQANKIVIIPQEYFTQ